MTAPPSLADRWTEKAREWVERAYGIETAADQSCSAEETARAKRQDRELVDEIAHALAQAAEEGIERAAKAVCLGCRFGTPLGQGSHADCHENNEEVAGHEHQECSAVKIRALLKPTAKLFGIEVKTDSSVPLVGRRAIRCIIEATRKLDLAAMPFPPRGQTTPYSDDVFGFLHRIDAICAHFRHGTPLP